MPSMPTLSASLTSRDLKQAHASEVIIPLPSPPKSRPLLASPNNSLSSAYSSILLLSLSPQIPFQTSLAKSTLTVFERYQYHRSPNTRKLVVFTHSRSGSLTPTRPVTAQHKSTTRDEYRANTHYRTLIVEPCQSLTNIYPFDLSDLIPSLRHRSFCRTSSDTWHTQRIYRHETPGHINPPPPPSPCHSVIYYVYDDPHLNCDDDTNDHRLPSRRIIHLDLCRKQQHRQCRSHGYRSWLICNGGIKPQLKREGYINNPSELHGRSIVAQFNVCGQRRGGGDDRRSVTITCDGLMGCVRAMS